MHIELLGLSGVRIQSEDRIILLAPPTQEGELKASRMKADIVVLGKPGDSINVDPRNESLFVVDGPGEYESAGVFVYCQSNPPAGKTSSLLSLLTVEGVTIAHLGGLDRDLTAAELDLFEGADILIIPVGGGTVISSKKAVEIVEKIEPRIVIPMHFARKGITAKYETPDAFLRELGKTGEAQEKLKVAKKDLPQETMEVCYLV